MKILFITWSISTWNLLIRCYGYKSKHTQKLLHPRRQTLTAREEGEAECWKESFVRNAAHTQPPHTRQCHIFTSHVSRQPTNNVIWYRSGIYLTQMLIDLAYLIRCRCEERHWFRVISRFLYKLFIADVVMCRWIIYWIGKCEGVQCLSTSTPNEWNEKLIFWNFMWETDRLGSFPLNFRNNWWWLIKLINRIIEWAVELFQQRVRNHVADLDPKHTHIAHTPENWPLSCFLFSVQFVEDYLLRSTLAI